MTKAGSRFESSVVSKGVRPRRDSGFTLVEVQIAIVLFVLVMLILLSHGGVFYNLLGWLENERRVHGVVEVSAERAIVTVAEAGEGGDQPPCEIRLLSIDTSGLYPVAEVQVRQRTL